MLSPVLKKYVFFSLSLLLVIVSIGLEWYGHACGFLLTPDSLNYLSAAQSFKVNGEFLNADGSYYAYWGPLFPILLSFFSDPLTALVWINVLCKIIISWTLLQIADSLIKNLVLKLIFLAASILSVHLVLISVFAWSELIFVTLAFVNVYLAMRLKEYPMNFYWMLITGLLMCLQRNAGLFWIGGLCIWLLFYSPFSLKMRCIKSIACFFISTAGLWGWNIYNTFYLTSDFNFYNHNYFAYVIPNLSSILLTFGRMLIPFNGVIGVIAGLSLVIAIAVQYALFKKDWQASRLLVVVLLVYAIGFLIMPGQLDPFDMDRYFSVIVPVFYLLIIYQLQNRMQSVSALAKIGIYLLLCVWLSYPLVRSYKNVQTWHDRSCNTSHASNPFFSFSK